jgi:subtilase family serine protease
MNRALILIQIIASLLAAPARAANERVALVGHVPEVVAKLQPLGRLEASQRLKLAIGLASRDEQGLDKFLQELYDPASPNYHHYLSPHQFTERFGPTQQDYKALMEFAKASGLTVTHQHSNRVVLDVEGSVADIEKALQVTLRTYQHPNQARTFYAPDVEPSLPLGLSVQHIGGLNNYTLPHPKHKRHPFNRSVNARPDGGTPKEGSAPGGQLWGNDFRDAYVPGTKLTGAGQNVGLLEFEGYYPSDITAYENAIGLNPKERPQLVIVSIDGGATPNQNGDNGEECSLDIEISVSIAPGLSNIYVFEAGGDPDYNSSFDDIFESMVTYTNVLQFVCCWGGSTEQDPTSEVLFKQMASQGQSFYDASGDYGAFVGQVEFPSDSPSIMQVGGTTMTDGGAPSYPWVSEVVWDWDSGPDVSEENASSSSGGISTYYAIPSWQTNISMTANQGSTIFRNTPDVAANADNCYIYSDDGEASGGWGGTSCAAPMWGGFTALINQQAAANGGSPVGFLNPALYALGSGPDSAKYFHDITSGNNTWRRSPNLFYAAPGYDLCCGLGTPTGTNLINALAPPAFANPPVLAVDVQSIYAVLAGQTATLSASFSGASPFTYQWTFNGQTLINDGGISGATSNVLTLTGVVAGESGTYQLLVTNAYGHSQSSQALLTVAPLPQLNVLSVEGSGFAFSYPTIAGATYQLQYTTDLNSGVWLPAGGPVTGAGTPVSTTNVAVSSTQRFFRLSITQ